MTNYERPKGLITLIILSTLLFALVLGGGLWLKENLPEMRAERISQALEAGDFDLARKLAGHIRTEEEALPYLQACDYQEAQVLMAAGDMEGAAALLAGLGNYEDAADMLQECRYTMALAAEERGEWETAAALFKSLVGYDVLEHLDACNYGLAGDLAAQGAESEALAIYSELGDYLDARELMGDLAMKITGISDRETAVNALSGLSAEELAQQETLGAQREALPRQIVDVGFYHTAGLKADGRVLTCGDNSYGQCDTDAWTDITAIAAGAYHTVGLRSDGTVVAVGRSSEAQCDTDGWTDVVEIAAGDYATFGLCADGTVLCTGYNNYPAVSGWSGISHISAGSYALGALRSSGAALTTHESAQSDELKGLVDLVLNTGYAVGLRSTGTVVSPQFELDWKQVIALSASGTGILGLTTDGNVLSHYFRPGDAPDFSGIRDAVAIAAGGTHSAVVLSDGQVLVLGENVAGQADTQDWRLFE